MDRHDTTTRAGSRGHLLVFCLVFFTTRVFAAGVEADGATNTTLEIAPNGVPVVNIANPNPRGLSHNSYKRFNVDRSGLILNNATQTVTNTQLGGQILGNARLTAPARLILNEVTSSNRSVLNGFTEVAGQGADVVIANPNGISINGAGFINVPRVTLTTGVPTIDEFGNLGGFDVRGGEITIDGAGLDTEMQDSTSIYAHYLNLNAKLHAKDLDIGLGRNEIDYPGRKIVRRRMGMASRVLLDSSALGGMYANKIVLVGTDKGLGINLPPEVIAANGDIRISSDGRLVLQQLDAAGQIALQAGKDITSTDTVYGAGDVDIESRDEFRIESGMIAARGEVSIRADKVSNKGLVIAGLNEDRQFNNLGSLGIEAADILNDSEIISTGALDLSATSITNRGLINAHQNLGVTADSLLNQATLFAGHDAHLFTRTRLDNEADAAIFAVNDLVLAAGPSRQKTLQITNELGLIQSLQGDIDIDAERFDNVGAADLRFEIGYYNLGKGREASSPGAAMNINLAYSSGYTKHNHEARARWVREVLSRLSRQAPLLYRDNKGDISSHLQANFLAIETRLIDQSITTPSILDSGQDLNLHVDRFINRNSVTAAARDINFDIAERYANLASSVSQRVTDYRYSTWAAHSRKSLSSEDEYSSIGRSYYIPVSRTKKVTADTVTQAGGSIAGEVDGEAVNSGVLKGSYQVAKSLDPLEYSAANIGLPSNDFGLFVKSTAPDSRYMIETNPRFTDLGSFVNSGYLLDRLDFSGSATLKRLGDGFYESKLIRDSVFAQSGRRYLSPQIQSDNQQFQFLMDNALIVQGELELSPGIALTRAQINRLTRDIVWLEQREVEGQTVLVPTVYLANGPKSDVRGGLIIAGRDTRLKVASLANDGLIESAQGLALEASDGIQNQGAITAAETLTLDAEQDIENRSGRIAGRDVRITSRDGSIVNRRGSSDYEYTQPGLAYSTTLLDAPGLIEAQDTLHLDAAERIEVEGSEVRGGQVTFEAGAVDITATAKSETYFSGDSGNHVSASTQRHFASSVSGGDIVILSVGETGVAGSSMKASGDLHVNAGSIDIDAVNDSDYSASASTLDKTFGETVGRQKSFRSRNIGSELSGTTVVLVTEHGDIELTGSEVHAQNRLAMNSAGDIRVAAGNDESLEERYSHESGWFSGGSLYTETEDLDGRVTRTAAGSRISAGTIDLDAAADIDIAGSEIIATEQVSARGQNIALGNARSEETHYSKHTEISVGFDDLASNLADIDELIEKEDGKLKLKLADARYEHAESVTTQTSVVASQIRSGGSINLDAGRESSGDIRIEGSDLLAVDSIELDATGDVALLDAHQDYSNQVTTRSGSAALNLTLQNEYDQVARSIKALRQAEHGLRHARDDYDSYRHELAARETELIQLQRQFDKGVGFIEQADIDDFERHLERMRDDKEFYQTNIALAAATLTSKTTAMVKQTGRAAASSGTYGFNSSLELDIDALEREVEAYYRQSRASNLAADRIAIQAGDSARLRGSNLTADDSIEISARDIEIVAGVSTSQGSDRNQHVNYTYTWDVLGNGGPGIDENELGGSLSGDGSRSDNDSKQHTNSRLQAGHIRLDANNDTTIKGADIHADEALEIVTGNLDVASVQDTGFSQSRSQGLSHSGAGGGIDSATDRKETVQTRLTRLTGQQVDITVADHTELQGALIASVDDEGADNGQLTLTTDTLHASSLNNTVDGSSRALGITGGEVSSLDYQRDATNDKTKSLATIGNGNIQITDVDGSDTRLLNRDIEDAEVAIYDIESQQGLSGELDTRLLTEDGRREIAEDWLKTAMIGNTIELIVTTDRVGIEDFFDETDKYHKIYEAVKRQIVADPQLAAMLQDSGLAPEQKQQMLDQVTGAVMREFGLVAHDNLIIATDGATPNGSRILGFFSEQTGNAYINDPEHNNTEDLITTAGHEASHAIDLQSDIENKSPADRYDNNVYADNFGENLASYTSFALDSQGYDGLAMSNEHVGNNEGLTKSNTIEFSGLNPEQGDFRQLHSYEIEWIKKNADRFAAYLCKRNECISSEEAESRLISQAFNRVQFGNEEWDSQANAFLRYGQGLILPDDANYTELGPLTSFYATPEQRANANIYLEEYRRQISAYQEAGIKQPTLDQILRDAKEHGEYSDQMARNLIQGSLIIGGLVLAPVAAGTPLAAELAAFSKNPVGYCMANPAGCSVAAEEAAYTLSGAVSANTVVPNLPSSSSIKTISNGSREVSLGKLPERIQKLAEANVTKTGETILGHFPGYIDKANSRGASFFDIGIAWKGLSNDERWAANRHFLDTIASNRHQVNLSLPKSKVRPGSWLEKEVRYLIKEKGYNWINQWSLKPGN